MLDQVRDLTQGALDVLVLLGVLCALILFAFAVVSLVLATFRVAVRGRVLVLPFGGDDARRIELTQLFVSRLSEIEQDWIRLARKVAETKEVVNRPSTPRRGRATTPGSPLSPISDGGALPRNEADQFGSVAGAAPRTSGDEMSQVPRSANNWRPGALAVSRMNGSDAPHR